MSVVIIFNGHRKTVKILNPNWLVQDVINDAAAQFSLNPAFCQLKHKQTIVTSSQLYRFANIPNNAQVDLLHNETTKITVQPVKLAFSIQDGGSVVSSFLPSMSLLEILRVLVTDGKVAAEVLERNPEFIYMRTSYGGESLTTTTLASLGMTR